MSDRSGPMLAVDGDASHAGLILHALFWADKGDDSMRIELETGSGSGDESGYQEIHDASRGRRAKSSESRVLTIREEDGVFRARLNDRTLRSIDSRKLRGEIAALNRQGRGPMIVLSMRNMESLASSCLGALAQLSSDLEQTGGVLVLYAVPKEVARMLKKTRLDRLIHTSRERGGAKKKARALVRKNPMGHGRHHAA